MIRYSLRCAAGHEFESWFRDSKAFDSLAATSQIACVICGDNRVEKAIMAPALSGQIRELAGASDAKNSSPREHSDSAGAPAGSPTPMLSGPAGPVEQALTQLRQFLTSKADYVGRGFADEARRIHLKEAEERTIWGEATPDEAKALKEEGIPVAPLPPLPRRND